MTADAEEVRSDFAKRHEAIEEARARARGKATALLLVLDVRGIEVSEEQREMISACRDIAMLERWLRRSLPARTVEDVLG